MVTNRANCGSSSGATRYDEPFPVAVDTADLAALHFVVGDATLLGALGAGETFRVHYLAVYVDGLARDL